MFKRYKSSLLSGLMYAACFPMAFHSGNLIPSWIPLILIWVAWVPVLQTAGRQSPPQAFRSGYVFGLTANALALFWVIVAMKVYGGMSAVLSSSILALMVMALAFFPALGLYWSAKFAASSGQKIWMAAIFLALAEELKVYIPFGGFPWLTPAYALQGATPLIQALDLFGVMGFNLFIFFTSTFIASLWRREIEARKIKMFGAALFSVLLILLAYGWTRMAQLNRQIASIAPVRAALIQGNIEQDRKWSAFSRREILETYASLSKSALEKEPVDLVVWPEASLPFLTRNDTTHAPVETSFLPPQTGLVFGAATSRFFRGKTLYINSAFYAGSDGTILGRYDKQHLVPFGEYVPMQRWIGWFVPAVAGNFSEGSKATVLSPSKNPFSILICYEALFPALSRNFVNQGAEFFFNLTNDAWFNETSGPYQHALFSKFRSIETRRSILRTANTGVSFWTDPLGHVYDATPLFKTDIVFAKAYPMKTRTLYVRFPWLLPLVCLFFLLLPWIQRRRNP